MIGEYLLSLRCLKLNINNKQDLTMKKSAFTVLCAGLFILFTACSDDNAPSKPEAESQPVVVKFQLALRQEVSSFQKTKNIPGNLPGDPTTKGDPETKPGDTGEGNEETATPVSSISFIEYALYKNDDNSFIKHLRKEVTMSDDSSVSFNLQDQLKPGTYKVCFIAHGIKDASFDESSGIVTFPDVKDTFWGNDEIEISATQTEQTFPITLKRAIAGIEFYPADPVPTEVHNFQISSSGLYNTINILDGISGEDKKEIQYSYIFTADDYGKDKRISHFLYTFVPNTEQAQIGQMTLKAQEKSGNVVRQKSITAVPIYRNKITRYTGTLYTASITDGDFQIHINTGWDGYVDKTLDD